MKTIVIKIVKSISMAGIGFVLAYWGAQKWFNSGFEIFKGSDGSAFFIMTFTGIGMLIYGIIEIPHVYSMYKYDKQNKHNSKQKDGNPG